MTSQIKITLHSSLPPLSKEMMLRVCPSVCLSWGFFEKFGWNFMKFWDALVQGISIRFWLSLKIESFVSIYGSCCHGQSWNIFIYWGLDNTAIINNMIKCIVDDSSGCRGVCCSFVFYQILLVFVYSSHKHTHTLIYSHFWSWIWVSLGFLLQLF